VLPKISSAIAQLVAPVTLSLSSATDQRKREGFQRFKKQESETAKKEDNPSQQAHHSDMGPEAKVIPLAPVQSVIQKENAPLFAESVSQALISFLAAIKVHHVALKQWLGRGVYETALRQQKKSLRFSRGILIDRVQ
jgi:hypothetical protein